MSNKEWIYVNDYNNTVRYILGIKGDNPLFCFGINPSTAEPENLDNTVKSVERLALNNNFDSWLMFNIYPQRSTDPKGMHQQIHEEIHKKNVDAFSQQLSRFKNPVIWCAWGTLIESRPYLLRCLKDFYHASLKHNCKWVCIGDITKKGHPRHPLYLNSRSSTREFDIKKYLQNY